MNKIKLFIFRYAKRHRPPRGVVFMNYSHIRSVALVFSGTENKEVERIVRRMEKDGMMVDIVGYEPKRDFTILGKPTAEAMKALPKQRFDLMLDLSTSYHIGAQHLLMAIDATFKSGLRFPDVPEHDQQGVLDMMISLPAPVEGETYHSEDIAEQIINFLKMINSK